MLDTLAIPPNMLTTLNTASNVIVSTTGSSIPSVASVSSISTISYNNGSGNWASITAAPHASLAVTGNATFDSDIVIKGKSLNDTLDVIQKRLVILVPDPKKLEHFEALQKAYAHYKTIEAMCQLPENENDPN